MPPPIAIVNCRFRTQAGALSSGVILIQEGQITGAGPAASLALPTDTILLDAERGTIQTGAPGANGHLAPGMPANIHCYTRYGEKAWEMIAGVIVWPPAGWPPPPILTWPKRQAQALQSIQALLSKRPETISLHQPPAAFRYDGSLVWQFETVHGSSQTARIRVVAALTEQPSHIFVLSGKSARRLPAASLSQGHAHWWFYLHQADQILYGLPIAELKRWLLTHASEIPQSTIQVAGIDFPLRGRALPIETLQQSITNIRIIRL